MRGYLTLPAVAALWDDWVGNSTGDGQVLAKVETDRLIVQWSCNHIAGDPNTAGMQRQMEREGVMPR